MDPHRTREALAALPHPDAAALPDPVTPGPRTPDPAAPGTAGPDGRSVVAPAPASHRPTRRRRTVARRPLHALALGTVLAVPLLTLSAVTAASGPGAGTAPTASGYGYPLAEPVEVVREFDAPEERWLSGHRGVDLRAAPGDPVTAPADGVVTYAGPVAGRIVLTLRHPDGRRSSVEPVAPTVTTGDSVARGALVGQVGAGQTHCAPATCLHWGVRTGADAYVDPLTLLAGRGPVVLLPGGP